MNIRIQVQDPVTGNYENAAEGTVVETTEGDYDNEYVIETAEGHRLFVQIPTIED